MDVERRTVISAGMDAGQLKTGMAEATSAVQQSTAQMARALLDSGRGFETLARNFVAGYREAINFADGVQRAYIALGNGRDKLGVLPQILDGLAAKWGLVGGAAQQAAKTMIDSSQSAETRLRALQSLIAQAGGTTAPRAPPITPAMADQFAGVRAPLAGDDLKDRQADIEAFAVAHNKAMDDMRAQYSPMFAAQRQYQEQITGISQALKLGAISEQEAAIATKQSAAAYTAAQVNINKHNENLDSLTKTTSGQQFAMRQLGVQTIQTFQGFATGQPIMMTLIQQGHQVVDVMIAADVGVRQLARGIANFTLALLTNPITLFIIAVAAIGTALAAVTVSAQNTAERLGTLRNQLSASRDDYAAVAAQVEAAAHHLAQTTSLGFTEASKAAAEFQKNPAFQGTQSQLEDLTIQAHRLSLVMGTDLPAATKILERGLTDAAGAAQILLDDKSHFGAAAGVTQAWVDSLKNLNQQQAYDSLIRKVAEVTAKTKESFTNLGAEWQRFQQLLTGDGPGFWTQLGNNIADGLAVVLRLINDLIEAWQRFKNMIGSEGAARVQAEIRAQGGAMPGGTGTFPDTRMTGDKEHDLAVIRWRESRNRNIENQMGPGGTPLSSASGEYQMVDATWREGAKMAGVDLQRYKRAIEAPFEIQHQVAGALYDRYGATPWKESAPGGMAGTVGAATEAQTIKLAQDASRQALQRRIDDNAKAQRDLEEGARVQDAIAARARERATTAPGGVEGPDYKAATADYETALRAGVAYRQQLVELRKAQYDLIDPQQKMARTLEEGLRPMQAMEGMTRRLAEVEQQYRDEAKGTGVDLEALSRARAATLASGTREIRDQVTALDIQTNSLRAQIPQMEEGGMVAERAAAFERAIVEARKAAIPGTRQHQQVVEDLTEAYRREIEVKRDVQAATDIAGSTRELEILATEARLIGATNAERERELAILRERQSLGLSAGQVADAEMQRAIDQKALSATTNVALQEQKAAYNELASATSQAFNQIGSSITDAIMSGNASAVTFLNIWKSVVAAIIQESIKLAVINPILKSLFPGPGTSGLSTAFDVVNVLAGGAAGGGVPGGVAGELGSGIMSAGLEGFAKGGIFNDGSGLSAYSNTIVTQPTLFAASMSGLHGYAAGAGLMAEHGPEAVLPLVRGPSGALGVHSAGGGGSSSVQINTPIVVNAAPGAGQNGQPAMDPKAVAELQRQVNAAVTNAVRATMANEKRPGGDLWR